MAPEVGGPAMKGYCLKDGLLASYACAPELHAVPRCSHSVHTLDCACCVHISEATCCGVHATCLQLHLCCSRILLNKTCLTGSITPAVLLQGRRVLVRHRDVGEPHTPAALLGVDSCAGSRV
jgi:hypothetical protein